MGKKVRMIMIRILFTVVFCFTCFCGIAQESSKFSADFSIGPSIPLGKFAGKNYNTVPNGDGLAKTGYSMYANLRYDFSNHIGVTLTAESSTNKQDPEAFSNYIS